MRIFLLILAFLAPLSTWATSEFLPYAEILAENAIISAQPYEAGYRLDSTITRAETAKLVMLVSGIDQIDCRYIDGYTFPDVDRSFGDLCGYIEGAADAGIIRSGNGLSYRPKQNLTRAELVKMLLAAVGEAGSDTSAGYSDVTASLGDLEGFINRAYEIECITAATYFRPNASTTRGEAFKIASCVAGLSIDDTPPVVLSGSYSFQTNTSIDTFVTSGSLARTVASFAIGPSYIAGSLGTLVLSTDGYLDLPTILSKVELYNASGIRVGTGIVTRYGIAFADMNVVLSPGTLNQFTVRADIIGTGDQAIPFRIVSANDIRIIESTNSGNLMQPYNVSFPVSFPLVRFQGTLGSFLPASGFSSSYSLIASKTGVTVFSAIANLTSDVDVTKITLFHTPASPAALGAVGIWADGQFLGSPTNGILTTNAHFAANVPRTIQVIADTATSASGNYTFTMTLESIRASSSATMLTGAILSVTSPTVQVVNAGLELVTVSPPVSASNKIVPNVTLLQEIGRVGLVSRGTDAKVQELYLYNASGSLNISDIASQVVLADATTNAVIMTGKILGKTVYFTGMNILLTRDITKTVKVLLRANAFHSVYYSFPVQLAPGIGLVTGTTGVVNGVKALTISNVPIISIAGAPTLQSYLLASIAPPFVNLWHRGNGVVQIDFLTLDESIPLRIEGIDVTINLSVGGAAATGDIGLRNIGQTVFISNTGSFASNQRLNLIPGNEIDLDVLTRRTAARDLYVNMANVGSGQSLSLTVTKVYYNNGDSGIDGNSVRDIILTR